jgi:hypothetical protein
MTLYLVKHGEGDYQLHTEDGTAMGSWAERPSVSDMAVAVSDHHGSPSKGKGGPPEFIRDDTKLSAGNINFRDLTIENETAPWR